MRPAEELHTDATNATDADSESLYAEFWRRDRANVKARIATAIVLTGALSGIALLARSLG